MLAPWWALVAILALAAPEVGAQLPATSSLLGTSSLPSLPSLPLPTTTAPPTTTQLPPTTTPTVPPSLLTTSSNSSAPTSPPGTGSPAVTGSRGTVGSLTAPQTNTAGGPADGNSAGSSPGVVTAPSGASKTAKNPPPKIGALLAVEGVLAAFAVALALRRR